MRAFGTLTAQVAAIAIASSVAPTAAAAETFFFGGGQGIHGIAGSFTKGTFVGEQYDSDFGWSRSYAATNIKYWVGGALHESTIEGTITEQEGRGGFYLHQEGRLTINYLSTPGEEFRPLVVAFDELSNSSSEAYIKSFSENYATVFIRDAVHVEPGGDKSLSGEYITMTAEFTPNYGLSLDAAAEIGGFEGFNWTQELTFPDQTLHMYAVGNPTPLTGTFADPPPGGYTYQPIHNSFPFYLTNEGPIEDPFLIDYHIYSSGASGQVLDTLLFLDTPSNACLPGGLFIYKYCDGVTAKGDYKFSTNLVGVQKGNLPTDSLYSWNWISTFNGLPDDPDSGTGGVIRSSSLRADAQSGTGGVRIVENSAAIPEPAIWCLLTMGFGLAGLAARRSRRVIIAI